MSHFYTVNMHLIFSNLVSSLSDKYLFVNFMRYVVLILTPSPQAHLKETFTYFVDYLTAQRKF